MRWRALIGAGGLLLASVLALPAPVAAANTDYVPLAAPARVLDTRLDGVTVDGHGVGGGMVVAGATREFKLGGRAGIPLDAAAVVLNVTIAGPTANGFATIYACDQPTPLASNVNFDLGETIPNLVTTRMSAEGKVCIYAGAASFYVVADAIGYYPAATTFVPLAAPARLLDTRPDGVTIDGHAQASGFVSAGTVKEFKVGGRVGIPKGIDGVVLNVTVTQANGTGFAVVYPCAAVTDPVPLASNLNFVAGDTVANLVTTRISAQGKACIYAGAAGAHFIADAVGWYPATSTLATTAVPTRVLDTRPDGVTFDGQAAATGLVVAGTVRAFELGGRAGVPDDAEAVILNITVTEATGSGYATVYACDAPRPLASNLNYVAGQTIPNLVITRTSSAGEVCIYAGASGTAHFIADVIGWFPNTAIT